LNRAAKAICLILVFCLLLGSGCWSRREMEGLAYILVMGIDKTETGHIRLVAQVGLPAQQEGDSPTIHVLTAEGRDISEAIDVLFGQTTKYPILSHMRLVIFSENLAKDGIRQVMDFIRRDIRVRLNVKVAVSSDDLEELLGLETPLSSQPALALIDLFNFNAQRSRVARVEAMDLVAMLLEPDLEAYLPRVSKGEDTYKLGETVIFAGDRMVGELDRNLTPGLLFLQNRVRGGVFTVPCGRSGYATTKVLSSRTRVHTLWEEERLRVIVEVTVNGMLIELVCNQDEQAALEDALAHYIINRIDDVIQLAQEHRTDFIGFSFRFRRDHPQIWQQVHGRWADVLADADFDLRCRVTLLRQGQTPR